MKLRNRIIAIALSLFISPLAEALTVNSCATGGQYLGTGATISISPTNGHTLLLGIAQQSSNNFTSLKDNNNNNFTMDNSGGPSNWPNCGGNCQQTSYFHLSNVSGVTGVTTVFSVNTIWALIVCDVTGLNSSPVDVIDNTGSGNSATTAWTTPSITTLATGDIVLGLVSNGQGNSFSGSGSWILAGTQDEGGGSFDVGMVYQIVTTATGYQPNITVSAPSTGGGFSAAYKPSATTTTAGQLTAGGRGSGVLTIGGRGAGVGTAH